MQKQNKTWIQRDSSKGVEASAYGMLLEKKNEKPSLARSSATICVAKPCQTLYQPVSLFGLQILIKFVLPLTLSVTPVKQRGMMLMKKNTGNRS